MDQKINNFLQNLKLFAPTQLDIVNEIRDMFKSHCKNLEEKFIYGGIGFYINNQLIGGAYAYKNHVSIVFGKGDEINDLYSQLEGGGKFRRHLKIFELKDLTTKKADYYTIQIVKLETKIRKSY